VDLEARAAGLEHHRVVLHEELVRSRKAQLVAPSAQLPEGLVEDTIARQGREVLPNEVGLPKRRQDARQHDLGSQLPGRPAHCAEAAGQVRLHSGEGVSGEGQALEVELEVEEPELGREGRIVEGLEQLERDGTGTGRFVDQEELLLAADPPLSGFDRPALEHGFQGGQVAEERLHEAAQLSGSEAVYVEVSQGRMLADAGSDNAAGQVVVDALRRARYALSSSFSSVVI
jgi:hypothetical protein